MSQLKFGRGYSLYVKTRDTEITVEFPFTIEFDIERSNMPSANFAKIRVYNLSARNRNLLLHDQYDLSLEGAMWVTLQAGYGAGPLWPVVFSGNATRAWSVREGTNFITTIECMDGGLAYYNAVSNVAIQSGTAQSDIIKTFIKDLAPYGISQGAISNFTGTVSRGQSYSGNTADLLRQLTNQNWFIDNGKANALIPGDVISSTVLTINAQSGLLGTPVKEQQMLYFDMLFEPRLAVGTQVNLQSSTAAVYNGFHEVISIHHRGVISEAVCGDAITSVGLRSGIFNEVVSEAGL